MIERSLSQLTAAHTNALPVQGKRHLRRINKAGATSAFTVFDWLSWLSCQVPKVIRQEASSPSYYPSRRRMHSYAACAGQTYRHS